MTIIENIMYLLSVPQFASTLGFLLAVSIVVGAVLNDNGRQLRGWIIAGLVYIGLQEMSRAAYLYSQHTSYAVPAAFTIIVAVVYFSGLLIGYFITLSAKKHATQYANDTIETIKSNVEDNSSVNDHRGSGGS